MILSGQRVRIENSPWTKANDQTGKVKGKITTVNAGDIFLVDFDNRLINELSSEVGGFTFSAEQLIVVE